MIYVVFDLDGTIVDHRSRTYGLHVEYCKARGLAAVPLAAYHARKAAGASERQTVRDSIPAGEMEAYMHWKRSRIETDQALALDVPWPEMIDLLARLQERAKLVLLTSRQSESQVAKELERLDISPRFAAILVEPSDGSVTAKLGALKRYLAMADVAPNLVVIVGDTECEIAAAKALGTACIAVTWGVRGEPFLATLKPDGIAHSVAELESLLGPRLGH